MELSTSEKAHFCGSIVPYADPLLGNLKPKFKLAGSFGIFDHTFVLAWRLAVASDYDT